METQQHGLCIIDDKFFKDFPSVRHMDNKQENRPYYLVVKEEDGIVWVVPLSSRVEKYEAKIRADEEKHGECIFYHIARVKGEKKAFLIGNIIPVTNEYIKKPFTVSGIPYMVRDQRDIKAIQSRTKRYLSMVRYGKLRPAVDILSIERVLRNRIANKEYMV